MKRGVLIALSGGLASAVLYLAFRTNAAGALIFTYLTPLPILLIGLSTGIKFGVIAAVLAIITIFLMTGPIATSLYCILVAVPVVIIIRQSLINRPAAVLGQYEWYPPGLILSWLTAYGVLLITAVTIYFSGNEGGISGFSKRLLIESFSMVMSVNPSVTTPFDRIAAFLPGMLISVWLLILILNATLAQNLVVKIGFSRRPSPLYREIELPQWLTIGLALSILLSFASGIFSDFGRNTAPLLSLPFFLLGLTVIHTLSRRVSARGLVLVGAYFLLVVVGWISAIIVLLGVLEQWVSLRSKFAQPKQNSGE
ncbi:MAG: DUF2232 domain-containing protein [Pseudomonadota bacterium]|nr:DUF2232 domain-containing protein [Pseudomonadota bacterium]